ncbi:hypothetical protein HZC31_07830 [Candidatus Woesearchaeota archaeon]|nr:hypothetical protein [Candidatus Woesearchaeota archaeon]
MDLLQRVKVYFGISQVEVYCQECGTDITGKNSVVETREFRNKSTEVKTYCPGTTGRTSFAEVLEEEITVVMEDTYNGKQVQRAIATGEITHYSKLEQKALE